MRRLLIALGVVLFGLAAPLSAQAAIVIVVDKTAQRLTVEVDGATRYQWPVSTARWGYRTPNGTYRPQRLERQWFSRKYDWSPMPYSIFFNGGYAIHGSNEVSRLGRPASHGCIRLRPSNAAILFDLVKHHMGDTRIVIIGGGEELMSRREPARRAPALVYRPPRAIDMADGAPRQRVIYQTPRPVRNDRSFEEIFDEPPRYRRAQRYEDLRWED